MYEKKMTKKNFILLKNIFCQDIDQKYNFQFEKKQRTHISDLKSDVEQTTFSYLDEAKKDHLCVMSMIDLIGKEIPKNTNIFCFWCRHPFYTSPIGCPIDYISQRIVKKYTSEISKDTSYMIRENISNKIYDKIQSSLDHFPIHKKCYYIVDGIFCSFPCCLSFIKEYRHRNPLYHQSEFLLHQMYTQIFGHTQIDTIMTAPSWRLLDNYGGNMTIEEFRKCFHNTHFIHLHQTIQQLPTQKMIGFLYEKQIKL